MMSLLQLWASTGSLANYVTQTSIAHLPKDKLEIVPLPVPPPDEQRTIAEALSDVDGLLAALEVLIAKITRRQLRRDVKLWLASLRAKMSFSKHGKDFRASAHGIYGIWRQGGVN